MNLTSIYERHDRGDVLYRLLSERDEAVNISHKKMPCFGEHVRFVESRPYEAWYFVHEDEPEPLGACYLSKQNEIGVFLFKAHQKKGLARQAVREIMRRHGSRRYLANISPRNTASMFLFSGLGFKEVQHTYELVA